MVKSTALVALNFDDNYVLFQGNQLQYGEFYRIKHIPTQQYLTVVPEKITNQVTVGVIYKALTDMLYL